LSSQRRLPALVGRQRVSPSGCGGDRDRSQRCWRGLQPVFGRRGQGL